MAEDVSYIKGYSWHAKWPSATHEMKWEAPRCHSPRGPSTTATAVHRTSHIVHTATIFIRQNLMSLLNGLELLSITPTIRMFLTRQILVSATDLLLRGAGIHTQAFV
jgi:hypothetical protein